MSIRESILANIVTTLSAVNGISYVTREPFKFEELSSAQFPACLIQTTGETRNDITMASGGTKRQAELGVQVVGFVKGASIDTARNSLIDLIETSLDADRTRGGYAIRTQVLDVETDAGSILPYGGVIVSIEIIYTFTSGSP